MLLKSDKNIIFSDINKYQFFPEKYADILIPSIGIKVLDFIWFFPKKIINWDLNYDNIVDKIDQALALRIYIKSYMPKFGRRKYYEIQCTMDDNTDIYLIYFNTNIELIKSMLPLGSTKIIFGKLQKYGNKFAIVHPDRISDIEDNKNGIEAVYKSVPKISSSVLSKLMSNFIKSLPELNEWYDKDFICQYQLPSWKNSINRMHYIAGFMHIDALLANKRLVLDEMIASQSALHHIRANNKINTRKNNKLNNIFVNQLLSSLSFTLTESQFKVISEIKHDLELSLPMIRLLQGDVGSGKTIVSLIAMLMIMEFNQQSVLVVPSTILAYQHYENIQKMLLPLNIKCVCLTSKTKFLERKKILLDIKTDNVKIIIGTHSVLQKSVQYNCLGLVIVDEQHKFGVNQRNALLHHQFCPNLLMLTATPIPRTLALAQYGDIDISVLKEKPLNRKEIKTSILSMDKLDKLVEKISNKLDQGEKAYWICPMIELSKRSNVNSCYEFLIKKLNKEKIGIIHGQLTKQEQDNVMMKFKDGIYQILISTTIIEIGIDIPDANIIIIEEAESFGLSQLHQLRGRIGRNNQQGYCILLHKTDISTIAYKRLKIIRNCNDGFFISEQDLALRGMGDITHIKQSGLPEFKIIKYDQINDILLIANNYVKNKNFYSSDLVKLFNYNKIFNGSTKLYY